MDADNPIARVPRSDMRWVIVAVSMIRDSMEHMEVPESEELRELVDWLKGYHNAAVQQYGGVRDQMIR